MQNQTGFHVAIYRLPLSGHVFIQRKTMNHMSYLSAVHSIYCRENFTLTHLLPKYCSLRNAYYLFRNKSKKLNNIVCFNTLFLDLFISFVQVRIENVTVALTALLTIR